MRDVATWVVLAAAGTARGNVSVHTDSICVCSIREIRSGGMFQGWNELECVAPPAVPTGKSSLSCHLSVLFQLAIADHWSLRPKTGISRQQWVIPVLLGSPAQSGSYDAWTALHCVLEAVCHHHLAGATGVSWRSKLGLCYFTWDPAVGEAQWQ